MKLDPTTLREAARRIERRNADVPRAMCQCCGENAGYLVDKVLEMLEAMAASA